MLVEIVKDGNTIIRVHDDSYDGRSKEEIQMIIDEYCRGVINSLRKDIKEIVNTAILHSEDSEKIHRRGEEKEDCSSDLFEMRFK